MIVVGRMRCDDGCKRAPFGMQWHRRAHAGMPDRNTDGWSRFLSRPGRSRVESSLPQQRRCPLRAPTTAPPPPPPPGPAGRDT